jgi:hypothetical protein
MNIESKKLWSCLLDEIKGGVVDRKDKPYRLFIWSIGYDGVRFYKHKKIIDVPPCDGEKDIMSLQFILKRIMEIAHLTYNVVREPFQNKWLPGDEKSGIFGCLV